MKKKPHPIDAYIDKRDDRNATLKEIKDIHRKGGIAIPLPSGIELFPFSENLEPAQEEKARLAKRAAMTEMGILSSPARIWRAPDAIQKASPAGKHQGWYRRGQTSGLPAKLMPIEVELQKEERKFKAELGKLDFSLGKRNAGIRSGKVRNATKNQINRIASELEAQGHARRHMARESFRSFRKQKAVNVRAFDIFARYSLNGGKTALNS